MRSSWMVVALVAVASGACGGSVASPIDDGGTSTDGNVSDTGIKDSGTSSKCPATLPTNQSSCALPEGFRCEYGTSSNTMCNTLATCTQGQWQVLLTGAFPQECSGTNPPACAPTFASVPVGQSCSKDYPTSCEYPEGICACTVDLNGPYPVDAAAVAKWYCGVPQQKECPVPRPKLGTDCNVGPNVVCDYGACILPGGAVLQCQNGSWQDAMYGCPD